MLKEVIVGCKTGDGENESTRDNYQKHNTVFV